MSAEACDYIVVGAGSAGCVLAARLSEGNASVCLLEAGPKDWHPMIHVPAGMLKLLNNPLVNWNFYSQPDAGTANRLIHWPRGRVLGGTSSINGMLYVRGNPADFDGWSQMGCRGWSYDEVLPYFRKSESYAGGEDAYRGRAGPLPVEDYRTILPLTHRFVEAAQLAGYTLTKDLNGARQEGVGYSQMTRRGRFRGSTARTFLAQAKGRPNLRVETGATATGLRFEGKRCTGVAFHQRGTLRELRANREVIVAGGAVGSPHLLQLSGIGSAEHLRSLGLPVRHDLPGVGANLCDHYVVRVSHRVRGQTSINELSRGLRLLREAGRWLVAGNGALTFGVTSAMVFCKSREGLASPDLQLLFTPASYDLGRFGMLEREPGMTVAVCAVRPASRGSVMAGSTDPFAAPLIRPNYLSARSDIEVLLSGLRQTRAIFAREPLARHSLGETEPGPARTDDGALEQHIRAAGGIVFHPVGTCKMGSDPLAVVDPNLRVHGLAGLRVVDASIMPTVTTGNTNAPTIMIAEKAADLIQRAA
ncbi:MAG: choline dehydrogenase [Alphaproteobacteria bacterium]|nr:choline dehydrogenase [Alphaproteobacteria bacterium]